MTKIPQTVPHIQNSDYEDEEDAEKQTKIETQIHQ